MAEENSLSLPGGIFIAHDREMRDYIYHITARMLFPKQEKDKGKRNRFLSHWEILSNVKKPDPQSMMEEAAREQAKGCVAGEAFMLQSLLAFEWDQAPSIRFLEYAVKQGLILNEHEAAGFAVKQLRPIYNKFGPVKHLWCADSLLKAANCKNDKLNKSFQHLFYSPGYFLGLAEALRSWAVKVDLAFKKTDLWMPRGWRDITEPFELGELDIGILKDLDKRWQSLGKLWEWYQEGQEWQPRQPQKVGKKGAFKK